tara:strand:- start:904 stop:1122 length:219 start_codon:yes stop_codon:yes gene_type:complete
MSQNQPSNDLPSSSRAIPIDIPKSSNNEDKNMDEYTLEKCIFDPNKSSPPNSWNSRLVLRLGDYSPLNISFK